MVYYVLSLKVFFMYLAAPRVLVGHGSLIIVVACGIYQLWHVGSSSPHQGSKFGPPALGVEFQPLNHWGSPYFLYWHIVSIWQVNE